MYGWGVTDGCAPACFKHTLAKMPNPDDKYPPSLPDEALRLAALRDYRILDTPAESSYDDFTLLASRLLGTPIALISLIDGERQWFKSRVGLDVQETPRELAFCNHAIQQHGLFVVEDASTDPRFRNNPLVTEAPHIRFYAGYPLVTPQGFALGTLCVIDQQARTLSDDDADTLRRLGRQLIQLLELRRLQYVHRQTLSELQSRYDTLQRLAMVAQQTTNVVIMSDPQGHVTWVNPAFEKVTGYQFADIVGKPPASLLHFHGSSPEASQKLTRALANKQAARAQILNRGKDGRLFWMDVDIQPQFGDNGELLGFVATETDITPIIIQRERLNTLFQALPVGLLSFSANGQLDMANPVAHKLLHWPGQSQLGTVPAEILDKVRHCLETRLGYAPQLVSWPNDHGVLRWFEVTVALLPGLLDQPDGVIVAFSEQTERVESGRYVELANATLDIGYWTWDLPTDTLEISARWAERMGLEHGQTTTRDIIHPDDQTVHHRQAIVEVLKGQKATFRFEERLLFAGEGWRWVLCGGAATQRDAHGRVIRLSGIYMDIHDRKLLENDLYHSATTDVLTGLPNRKVLEERLSQSILATRQHHRYGALLLMDLDHFKRINDTYGHAVGDQLLSRIATRLRGVLHDDQTLARMGGDELMVLLPEVSSEPLAARMQALHVATKIQKSLELPFEWQGVALRLGASIGISIFPKESNETADDVIREADTAMYQAKSHMRGGVSLFEPDMRQDVSNRLQLEMDLRTALARREFELYLQGKWSPDRQLLGAEALIRWHHPIRGMMSPGCFIPVVEETDLVFPLGRWIIKEACRIARTCRARQADFVIAVNVSPKQFQHPQFADDLRKSVQQAGLPPGALMLEITEGVLLQPQLGELIQTLTEEGFRFSLDDFGTGYSSLAYLKRVPVQEIKIDRAFVRDLQTDANDAALVQAILLIAEQFGIQTVAEGVETESQAQLLADRGCQLLQGFLFDQPTPWKDFHSQHLS
jgi:diguanylate cyclase (GGDEF)-like protein/PAS domain S-box-containing protein